MRFLTYLLLFAGISFSAYAGNDDTELLPAEQAFRFNAEVVDDNTIHATWEIADGYYMYRDKMEFRIVGDNVTSDEPVFPSGVVKQDELFGSVEVYTAEFKTDIGFSSATGGNYQLIAKGQGCNEPVGVCYPPMSHEIAFAVAGGVDDQPETEQTLIAEATPSLDSLLPETTNETSLELNLNSTAGEGLSEFDDVNDLRELLAAGFEQPDFLDVDDAFKVQVDVDSASQLTASFAVAEGYYLYRDKIGFTYNQNARPINTTLPDGIIKQDEYFGEVAVFKKDFSVPLKLDNNPGTQNIALNVTYQGCAEDGICYPPVSKTFDLLLPLVATAQANTDADTDGEAGTESVTETTSNTETTAVTTQSAASEKTAQSFEALLPILAGAFIAGLLLTFTPCVLPMIPILSSIIVGQGQNMSKFKGGMLAIFYVLGTSVTYAAMGAIAGATGDQLQAYFQNVWAIGILCTIFVLMALSMFGVFEFQTPSFIQTRLQEKSGKLTGSIPLVFILGVVSALIVGACVSPVLISFLSLAVSQGDPILGAEIMFTMALGMGVPLIILGFGAGHLIPKAGQWMETVKHIFGVMLIAVAIYLLEALPQVPTLLIWGCFLIVLSVYLGAFESPPAEKGGWRKFAKGLGIIFLIWGVAALIGGSQGRRDLFDPIPRPTSLTVTSVPSESEDAHLFTRVNNMAELDAKLLLAKQQNKKVMIDYYADWCVDCVRMEKTTFKSPEVKRILEEQFIALQVDVTDPNDADRKALKKRYNVFGPPAVLFLDSNGNEHSQHHFYGYKDTEEFLALLSQL